MMRPWLLRMLLTCVLLGGGSWAHALDLTGLWQDDSGGDGTYRLRQINDWVYWVVDGTPQGSYVNLAYGQISGSTLNLTWQDMPGSPTLSGGSLALRIESNDRLVKITSSTYYGANAWNRIGSAPGQGLPPPPPVDSGQPCGPRGPEWTAWADSDDADATGDYEPLPACPQGTPQAIECCTLDGREWSQAGQVYTCAIPAGGACVNSANPGGCHDYRIRVRCGTGNPTGGGSGAVSSQPNRAAAEGAARWTGWLNRDSPRDLADWEALADHASSVPCAQPIAIECRVSGGADWSRAGQRYHCSLKGPNPGGICVNAENPGGCLDYEVRFLCP
jgi:hypothetical protein